MAGYLDTLMTDRARLRQSLRALIEDEAAQVRSLQEQLTTSSQQMDQMIVRLMIYRGLFGAASTQALDLQTAIEDAGKPHAQLTAELEQHQRVLQAMQEALVRLEQGGRLDEAAPLTAPRKLSVADLLGE